VAEQQPRPGASPPGAYPPTGYPPPYAYQIQPPKPRHPRAVTVVVLGSIATVGGLATGGLTTVLGPVAWALGARAKREIAAEPDRWSDEDLVTIGYILGIVATVMLVLALLAIAIVVVVVLGILSA
jgi:hypothetical protein